MKMGISSVKRTSMLACVVFGFNMAVVAQATTEVCGPIYQKFLDNRKGPELEKYKLAVTTGKEYLEKCKSLEESTEITDYVQKQLPNVEKTVKIKALEARFDQSIPKRNWDEAFSTGKELLSLSRPYELDMLLVLAFIGFDGAAGNPPVDKFKDDTIKYAKLALQKLESGVKSENYGFFQITYKTSACDDGKTNAIGWMNYTIGFITVVRNNQRTEGLPYLFKATQVGCDTKRFSEAYRLIGAWYLDGMIRINDDRAAKFKLAGDKDTEETKQLYALQLGYADRAIDAYARAYKLAVANQKASQPYKEGILKKLQELVDFRFDGKRDGIEAFINDVETHPFPDPSIAVNPVINP